MTFSFRSFYLSLSFTLVFTLEKSLPDTLQPVHWCTIFTCPVSPAWMTMNNLNKIERICNMINVVHIWREIQSKVGVAWTGKNRSDALLRRYFSLDPFVKMCKILYNNKSNRNDINNEPCCVCLFSRNIFGSIRPTFV